MLRLQDLRPTALHNYGSASTMAEEADLFFGELERLLGEPVESRDPEHPEFVPIAEAPEPNVRPGDAEDAMIALLDAARPRRRR